MGLWLLQQCRISWEKKDGLLDYAEIVKLAEMAAPFSAMIDPDYPGFYNPLDMPAAIETYCSFHYMTGLISFSTVNLIPIHVIIEIIISCYVFIRKKVVCKI